MGLIRAPPPQVIPNDPAERRKQADADLAKELAWAACPRSVPSGEERSDWVALTTPPESGFIICSTCFGTSVKHTSHARFFATGQTCSGGAYCDFGSFWVRQAWTWTLWRKHPDPLLLLYAYRATTPDQERERCPNRTLTELELETPAQVRMWFSIVHPKTNRLMDEFTICSACLRGIEVILPILRGMFVPAAPHACEGRCDIVFRRPRSWALVEHLMDHAADIEDFSKNDSAPIIKLLEDFARLPDCNRHLRCRDSHLKASSIPDFTVCQACFETVIAPDMQKQELQSNSLLGQFRGQKAETRGEFVCRLYSERTRKTWHEAVDRNDVNWLWQRVSERIAKEIEKDAFVKEGQAEVTRHMANNKRYHQQARMNASFNAAMATSTIGSSFRVTTDTGGFTSNWNNAQQCIVQAREVLHRIHQKKEDWRLNWE